MILTSNVLDFVRHAYFNLEFNRMIKPKNPWLDARAHKQDGKTH